MLLLCNFSIFLVSVKSCFEHITWQRVKISYYFQMLLNDKGKTRYESVIKTVANIVFFCHEVKKKRCHLNVILWPDRNTSRFAVEFCRDFYCISIHLFLNLHKNILGLDGWSLSQNNVFLCGGTQPGGHRHTTEITSFINKCKMRKDLFFYLKSRSSHFRKSSGFGFKDYLRFAFNHQV